MGLLARIRDHRFERKYEKLQRARYDALGALELSRDADVVQGPPAKCWGHRCGHPSWCQGTHPCDRPATTRIGLCDGCYDVLVLGGGS